MDVKIFKYVLFGFIPFLMGFTGCEHNIVQSDSPQTIIYLLKEQSFHSGVLNREIKYMVLLPKEYNDSTTSFPVVYLLHGWGDDETAWYQGGNIKYYVDTNSTETVPMIYVMPQGFNTYWVNKYNGDFPYMDMLVSEMVPLIDARFRTIRGPEYRAVMGYSMGGYGALILPAKNPGVFKTGVALSMSYRTDKQYMDESQGVFDLQWGSVFGGIGASGTDRITDYYKSYNPFYFFSNSDDLSINGQNYYFDCGDDEENLSEPNNALSNLLRDLNIKHEYRVRDGAHDWEYWHSALPEALKYISSAVQNIPYVDNSVVIIGSEVLVPAERILKKQLEESKIKFNIILPTEYLLDTINYSVIFVLHDRDKISEDEGSQDMLSLLCGNMDRDKLPASLIVEIPIQEETITALVIQQTLELIRLNYRTAADREQTILIGNNFAGLIAFNLIPDCSELFNACLLFDADIPADAEANGAVSYYLDICDEGINYKGYHSLYMSLRNSHINHDYRVRQGTPSYNSFLIGLDESSNYMKIHLKS